MKNGLHWRLLCLVALSFGFSGISLPPSQAASKRAKPAKPQKKPKSSPVKMPAVFYDSVWEYRTATLYGKNKNIVSGVSGEAQFQRDGKFRQDYYIGSIGNFYKGTYKIASDRLVTYDEDGKKIFDFGLTVGTTPPVLVLSLFNEDGSKSIDYSLVPKKK